MMQKIADLPDHVIAIAAHGQVTGDDYERVLIPAVETALEKHKTIRFLYHLGADFTGFTAAALWDDAKVGIRHLTAFEKVAVVTDIGWIGEAVKVFGLLIPCPTKVFRNDELPEARAWIVAST